MTEQMQDELDQKDQTIQELNRQLSESLTLNEKLNSENRAENIEALRTRLRQTEERLTSETDSRKRADAEVVAWYSITITLFTAILPPVFLNDCITFFGVLGKGMGSLFREFVIGADSFGQLSSGIPNRILSGLMYWLIVAIVIYFGEWIKNAIPINLMVL